MQLNYRLSRNKKRKKKMIHLSIDVEKANPNYLKYGLQSLQVLSKNIDNKRYLGFSNFLSSNTLQNSSYIWSFPKSERTKRKDFLKLNDNIYNIPDFKTTRSTSLGYGSRINFTSMYNQKTPSCATYNIKSLFDINLIKRKGPTMTSKPKFIFGKNKNIPGPGAYNLSYRGHFGLIPIKIKSRHNFFYDDIIKQKRFIILKQFHKPKYKIVERNRFSAITFGIGERPKLYKDNKYPGPGTYNIPGCFDRGLKGKLPLN